MESVEVGKRGNRRAGFDVLPQIHSPDSEFASKGRAHQTQGELGFCLRNKGIALVICSDMLLIFGARHRLAIQSFRAFEAELSELGCRPISLQLFDFRGIVDLEQRGASLDDFATFKMNPGHAPSGLGCDKHLLICDHRADSINGLLRCLGIYPAHHHSNRRDFGVRLRRFDGRRLRSVSNRNRPPTAVAIIVPINTSFAGTRRTGLMISPRGRYL